MEKDNIDYTKISLEETGLFNKKYSPCASTLSRLNITNVAQLLDNDFINSVNEKMRQTIFKDYFNGFVALVRHKYLDEPLDLDFLDSKVDNKFTQGIAQAKGFPEIEFYSDEYRRSIRRVCLPGLEIDDSGYLAKEYNQSVIDFFRNKTHNYVEEPINKNNSPEDISLRIMDIYVKAYDKKYNVNIDNYVELASELKSLLQERDNLDKKIEIMKKKLELISRGERQGGINK